MATAQAPKSKLGSRLGLRIKPAEINGFKSNVESALQKSLGLRFVKARSTDCGSYDLYYFTTNPPMSVLSEQRTVPCLPVKNSNRMLIAVEVKIGRTGERKLGEHFLEHISIKSYEGEPNNSARLLFRAEWDARDSGLQHAQPHWNIHSDARSSATRARGFQDYLEQERAPDFHHWTESGAIQSSPISLPRFEQIRMHFAMASTWQHASGTHSCELQSVDDATRWIGGCCTYLKLQFGFLDGVMGGEP